MYEGQCKHRELSFELSFTFCPLLHHAQEIHHFNFIFSFFNMSQIRKRCFCGGIGVHNLFSGGDVVFFHFLCVCSCKGSSCLSSTKRRSTQTNWTKTRTLNKKKHAPSIKKTRFYKKKNVSSITKNTHLQ